MAPLRLVVRVGLAAVAMGLGAVATPRQWKLAPLLPVGRVLVAAGTEWPPGLARRVGLLGMTASNVYLTSPVRSSMNGCATISWPTYGRTRPHLWRHTSVDAPTIRCRE